MKRLAAVLTLGVAAISSNAHADLINELEPLNAMSGTQSVEIKGTAGASYSVDLVALSTGGVVDRAIKNASGTFDSNGLALLSINDLADPTYTLLLTQGFNKNIGDDLDSDNNGVLNAGSHWGVLLDAVGISGSATGTMYAESIGGVNLFYNGESPDLVFRDGTSDDWYVTINSDTDSVFDKDGNDVLLSGSFDQDPFVTTFGGINPSFTAVPEPTSAGLLSAFALAACLLHRRRIN